MREIKFRAWIRDGDWDEKADKNSFVMIDGNSLAFAEYRPLSQLLVDVEDDAYYMQFTGLSDKNGKEIYEGDILNVCNGSINGMGWTDPPREVKWKIGIGGFNLHTFMWDKDGESNMDSTHWCEVIGNIYENPELINR